MEAFILAGGQSRRFGENKALFKLGQKRVIDRIIETAKLVCPTVTVVVKSRETFRSLKVPVVEDLYDFQSPVVCIYTALETAVCESVMILSVDIPLIKESVLRLLVKSYREPVTIFRARGKLHPLIGVYSKALNEELREYIESGHRSVMGFLERVDFNVVGEEVVRKVDPELESFLNMNTKDDLREVLERREWT